VVVVLPPVAAAVILQDTDTKRKSIK